MSIFNFKEEDNLGNVIQVDTTRVFIRVPSSEKLAEAKLGRLTALKGRPGEWLIAMVERVIRKFFEEKPAEEEAKGGRKKKRIYPVGTDFSQYRCSMLSN